MRGLALVLLLPMLMAGCFGSGNGLFGDGKVQPADYASDKTYKTWVIEVDHSNGATPDSGLLDFVKARLASVVKKDSIEFRPDETLATDANKAWTDNDIQAFADQHASLKTAGGKVVTHLVFLTGHSADDNNQGKILGKTFDHGLIVIFSDSVKSSCSNAVPLFGCDASPYFRSVVTHEFGHALGLVDNGAPMQVNHLDSDTSHGKHSSNKDSVMYWAVESSQSLAIFAGKAPPSDFDDNDRADVRAMQ